MNSPVLPGVAVADLSARTKLRLTGADRVRFLNGQVSNDVRRASPTSALYTCVMTIKGKMCADAFIHASADALWLDAEPDVQTTLPPRLERYIIADDVTLEDVTGDYGLLHVFPADDCSSGLALTGLRCLQATRYGSPGLDYFGDPAAIAAARAQLSATWPILAPAALEAARIRAGVPRWGAELHENTMPAEAGLETRAVSYDKGCYIGQEVVSRVKSVGHVNRQLRGLRFDASTELQPGWRLFALDVTTSAEREVGRVTSVASAPADARARIALAFLRRGWETAGGVLLARPAPSDPASPQPECRVTVCELPFT